MRIKKSSESKKIKSSESKKKKKFWDSESLLLKNFKTLKI